MCIAYFLFDGRSRSQEQEQKLFSFFLFFTSRSDDSMDASGRVQTEGFESPLSQSGLRRRCQTEGNFLTDNIVLADTRITRGSQDRRVSTAVVAVQRQVAELNRVFQVVLHVSLHLHIDLLLVPESGVLIQTTQSSLQRQIHAEMLHNHSLNRHGTFGECRQLASTVVSAPFAIQILEK